MTVTRRRLSVAVAIGLLAGGLLMAADGRGRSVGDAHTGQWRTGDIIFLDGTSLRSRVVRLLELYSTDFSHVGIVVVEDGVPYVVHADPRRHKVIRERWDAILAAGQIVGAAIYRVKGVDASTAAAAGALAQRYAREGVQFDSEFDLKTPDRLYCTELVLRSYRGVGVDFSVNAEALHQYLLPAHLLEFQALERMLQF